MHRYKLQNSVKERQPNYSYFGAVKLALEATTAVLALNVDSLERMAPMFTVYTETEICGCIKQKCWQNWLQYKSNTADT